MVVDAHVHDRDFYESGKETVAHALEVARDSGVSGIFVMPNTKPAIINREVLARRLGLAKEANVPEVYYGVYLGATSDPEQLKKAVELYREFFPRVVGIKMYAGESVGDLAIIDPMEQLAVYGTLAQEGYKGVLVVHAEKEEKMHREIWSPNSPITHCFARPEEAEISSIADQILLVKYTGFKGKLHIPHISSPGSVDLVTKAREEGIDLSCGVCPHHFVYDFTQMSYRDGILLKMNPPLRKPGDPNIMLELLREGKIDWIETDHAPHTLEDKFKRHMSGIPGLPWWPLFLEYLRWNDFSEKRIEEITFDNVLNRFGFDIKKNTREIKDRRRDYSFNPNEHLEAKIGWGQ